MTAFIYLLKKVYFKSFKLITYKVLKSLAQKDSQATLFFRIAGQQEQPRASSPSFQNGRTPLP